MAHPMKQKNVAELTCKPMFKYQKTWNAILKTSDLTFTVRDICTKSQNSYDNVRHYFKNLCNSGYLKKIDELKLVGSVRMRLYKLAKRQIEAPVFDKGGKEKESKPSAFQNMWQTMKMLRVFTAKDLAIASSTKDTKVSLSNAKTYLVFLKHARYVAVLKAHSGGKGRTLATYRFLAINNSGPQAPKIVQDAKDPSRKAVFDVNKELFVWDSLEAGAHE